MIARRLAATALALAAIIAVSGSAVSTPAPTRIGYSEQGGLRLVAVERANLGDAISAGEATWSASSGQVADDAVRQNLAAAIEVGRSALTDPFPISHPWPASAVVTAVSVAGLGEVTSDIAAATQETAAAHQAWALAQVLASADAGQVALDSLATSPADETLAATLRTMLEQQVAPLRTQTPVVATPSELLSLRDQIDVATADLLADQTAKAEAEAARIAEEQEAARIEKERAEKAAAAAAAAEATPKKAESSKPAAAPSRQRTTAPAPSSPAPAAAPAVEAPPAPAGPKIDKSISVVSSGWQAELDRCNGVVRMDQFPFPALGQHWSCGGKSFPRTVGSVVQVSGQGLDGIYRVTGMLTGYNPSHTVDDVPSGHALLFQTCLNGDSNNMAFVTMEKIG